MTNTQELRDKVKALNLPEKILKALEAYPDGEEIPAEAGLFLRIWFAIGEDND